MRSAMALCLRKVEDGTRRPPGCPNLEVARRALPSFERRTRPGRLLYRDGAGSLPLRCSQAREEFTLMSAVLLWLPRAERGFRALAAARPRPSRPGPGPARPAGRDGDGPRERGVLYARRPARGRGPLGAARARDGGGGPCGLTLLDLLEFLVEDGGRRELPLRTRGPALEGRDEPGGAVQVQRAGEMPILGIRAVSPCRILERRRK